MFVKTPIKGWSSDRCGAVDLRNLRVMCRRFFMIWGFTLGATLAPALPAAADTDAAEFIDSLGNQTLEVIRDGTSLSQKQTYFHQLFSQDFDLSAISRFVLGSYWRVASEAERQEFQRLFEDHVMMTYGPQLANYRAQRLKITGKRAGPGGLVIASQIIRPDGVAPIPVDWHLTVSDGLYKISDIVIDGISMAMTQRSEFAQMIQRNGGQVEGLLAAMRQRR